jgi:DNA-binding MarR family transcriptional regulator
MLRRARNRVLAQVFAALARAGMDDLREPHMMIFQWPGPHGVGPLELARRADMSKQAMNQLLGTLERAGYIVRRRDPQHGKQRVIELTERGWRAIRVIRKAVRAIESDLERKLGTRRYQTLVECLREI